MMQTVGPLTPLPILLFIGPDDLYTIPYRMKIQNCSQIPLHSMTIQLCPCCPTRKSGKVAWAEVDGHGQTDKFLRF